MFRRACQVRNSLHPEAALRWAHDFGQDVKAHGVRPSKKADPSIFMECGIEVAHTADGKFHFLRARLDGQRGRDFRDRRVQRDQRLACDGIRLQHDPRKLNFRPFIERLHQMPFGPENIDLSDGMRILVVADIDLRASGRHQKGIVVVKGQNGFLGLARKSRIGRHHPVNAEDGERQNLVVGLARPIPANTERSN